MANMNIRLVHFSAPPELALGNLAEMPQDWLQYAA